MSAMLKKKLPYKRVWEARLLSRKMKRDSIPIEVSLFRKIKGTIGLHGYRRVRNQDRDNVRAYRKDTYGTTFIFIDIERSAVEGKTETWGGLMAVCSDFGLRSYKPV
jgi:hypothetical protein